MPIWPAAANASAACFDITVRPLEFFDYTGLRTATTGETNEGKHGAGPPGYCRKAFGCTDSVKAPGRCALLVTTNQTADPRMLPFACFEQADSLSS
jgi:hypothetical protein